MIRKAQQKILDFLSDNKQEWVDIGKITPNEIKRIKEATGFDLTGFTRMIDRDGINHVKKRHFKGKVAVMEADFILIPFITSCFDEVEIRPNPNAKGLTVLRYKKQIGSIFYYLEEIRPSKRRKKVCIATLYKKPLKK